MPRNKTELSMLASLLGMKDEDVLAQRMAGAAPVMQELAGGQIGPDMMGAGFQGVMNLLFPQEDTNTAVSSITPSQTARPAAQRTARPAGQPVASENNSLWGKASSQERAAFDAAFMAGEIGQKALLDAGVPEDYRLQLQRNFDSQQKRRRGK